MRALRSRNALSFVFVFAALGSTLRAQISEYSIPTAASRPYTIVSGPEGDLWFTESLGNKIGRIDIDGTIVEYTVPTSASGPYGIAVGPDGNIWFTERFGDKIGRLSPKTGELKEFKVPTPLSQPWEIAAGPDGHLWFTEEDADQIGRVTTQGLMKEFVLSACCFPTGITAAADGNVWFTIEIGDLIGRIDPTGSVKTFTIPSTQVLAWDITPGPDSALRFTELAGRAVGKIDQLGNVQEYPVPGPFSGIAGATTGPDGDIWYTENDTDHVGVMDAAGNVLASYDTSSGARPLCITTGIDGNLWFTEADGNAIGRMKIAQPNVALVLASDTGFAPRSRTVKLGDEVRWMFIGPNKHSVVDASGLGLFSTMPHRMVSFYSHSFGFAGTFAYHDGVGSGAFGGVSVPVILPASGNANQPFAVTWSTGALPPNAVFDVEVRVPGSNQYVAWTTSANPSENYTPSSVGIYGFRARMRDTSSGAASFFSRPAATAVH